MSAPGSPPAVLLDAVIRLVAADGLEAVTVRRVAAAAGVSVGAVQHHFPTKRAMLLAAVARVAAVTEERLVRAAGGDDPREALRAVLLELAALGPGDREATAVWLAFVARACSDEEVARRHREQWRRVEDQLAGLLARAGQEPGGVAGAGAADGPRRLADAAAELLALVDGIAVAVAVEPARMPPARARDVVSRALDRRLAAGP